ncbi:hypothetical protein [Micrococcus terreus]|uniref:Integral membrane protein n=1 Tax=Micrococcus terreus TaxID=574650 RepID=A0A1I7MF38_9MICC|nr:hypothetical protein [Micrococcus terreus]SFV20557.1 hypothetical protein SAMN04487966_101443 [Micrococcus terreus]
MPASTPAVGLRHPLVVAAVLVLFLQAAAVLWTAVRFARDLGTGVALNLGGQIFLVVLVALGGVWLVAVAIGVWRGGAWSRSAATVVELFAVILSVSYLSAGNWLIAAAFLVPAAAVLVMLFSAPVGQHLSGAAQR